MTGRAEQIAAVLAEHRKRLFANERRGDTNAHFTIRSDDAQAVWRSLTEAVGAALAAQEGGRTPYRPCAGCDAVGESCRAVGCPATQEGGRGGADTTTAAVEAVLAEGNLAYWGKVWVTTDDVRAALSDPVGALARHDAEVQAKALRDAAEEYAREWDDSFAPRWLRERADRIEGNQP